MTHPTESASPDIRSIFDKIRFATERPIDELCACVNRREEAAAVLMEILDGELAKGFGSDKDLAVPFAMLLLAEMRHRPAYGLLQKLARHPQAEEFLGELLIECLGRCLAACWDGQVSSLTDLVKDASVDANPRNQAVVAVMCLVTAGERTREDALEDLKGLMREALATKSSEIAAACVIGLWDLYPDSESEKLARELYAKGLVDDDILPLSDLDEVVELGLEAAIEAAKEESLCSLRVDAVSDSEWWSCWGGDEDSEFDASEYDENGDWIPPEPIEQLVSQKVGRNDPCPCGSGKKHKKCCGK
ncbi:MAG: DUF1186 domain-containing protein [Fibrobacterota bacterium]